MMAHEDLEVEHSLLTPPLNEAELSPSLLRRFASAKRTTSTQWVGTPDEPKTHQDTLQRR